MLRLLLFLGPALLLLPGCNPQQKLDNDRIAIISAILVKQYDGSAERKAALAKEPELKLFYEDFLDFRQCVSTEVAGKAGEFSRKTHEGPASPLLSQRDLINRWKDSDQRFPLEDQIELPGHLRWNSPFSICPSGVLYMGTPEVSGNSARVFITSECSGWCGWGGEIDLRRQAGRWQIEQETNWWQS